MRLHNNLKQGSEEWLNFRKQKVSGTCFAQAISDKKETRLGLIYDLIAEKYSTQVEDSYVSPEMTRGTFEEKYAAEEYGRRYETNLEVIDICQHDEYDWLIFSPDRFANKRTRYVEFKCPNSSTMIKYTLANKIPSAYKAQILLSFIVNEKQKDAHLAIYDPRFKEYNHQLTVIKITREELDTDIEDAKANLVKFIAEWQEIEKYYEDLIF